MEWREHVTLLRGGEVDGVECVEMGEHRREETGG